MALLCAVLAVLSGASQGQGTQPTAQQRPATGVVSVTLTPPPPPTPIDPTLAAYLRVAGVRVLQQTGDKTARVEFDLAPSSQKLISAFGISLTARYSDGSTVTSSFSEDELEATYRSSVPGAKTVRSAPWGGPLVYGQVRTDRASVPGGSAERSLVSIEGQVMAIVFFDRTARGDSSLIQRIAADRKAKSDGRSAFLKNLRAAMVDPDVRDAIGKRSADAGDRLRAAFLAQPQPAGDPGVVANRIADLNYLVRALARSQAAFDYMVNDRRALQELYATHSVIKEEK